MNYQIFGRLLVIATIILFLPVFVFAQGDVQKKKAYLFYLDSCPHCHNVDNYFKENGIYEKYDIERLDAANPFNANLLGKFYDVSGKSGKGGVPALAFDNQFLIGDKPIIDNFVKEIDASNDAFTLPDPEKFKLGDITNNQEVGTDPESGGNKNKLFLVVIGTLVIVGAGALVYVRSKRSKQ